jgi:hypothetical protein
MVLATLCVETRGEVVGSVVVRYDALASSSPGLRWDGQIHARVCTGCVPSRCFAWFFFQFISGCHYGSSQSLWAVVLSWACGWGLLVSAFSGDMADGGSRRKMATLVDMEALKDFHVIFFFAEDLCEVWMGQLSPLYPLRMCSYVYVFLTW